MSGTGKMYRRMEETKQSDNDLKVDVEPVEACSICMDPEKGGQTNMLCEKFGCDCKQTVHEDCLSTWVAEQYRRTRRRQVGCIQCRKEVAIDKNAYEDYSVTVWNAIAATYAPQARIMTRQEEFVERLRQTRGTCMGEGKQSMLCCLLAAAVIVIVLVLIEGGA